MDLTLTDRQRELIDIAETLGREKFAPRAARYDNEASFPFENYDDLREAGFLGLCIPEAYGGLGADYETYCLVAAEIGRHCGATALTFNMHSCSMMWSGALADDLPMSDADRALHEERRKGHFVRVLKEGAIFAQPFSEGSAAAAGRAPFGTSVRKVDGGWLMNGKKIFASLAGAANYYGVLCTEEIEGKDADRALHEERRKGHFVRVLKDGAIFAQPFSEGSAAAAGRAPFGTSVRKVDGGWLMNGKKIFASLAGAANYYGVLCTEEIEGKDADMKDTLYLAVPADADGLEVVGPWDPLGMRGTVSRNLIFKDVFIPDGNELLPRGVYYKAASLWPHMFFTLAPTYMGIAEAAYEFTVKYLRGELEGMPPVKRRMYPTKQIAVAQMYVTLEQTRALFKRTISEAKVSPPREERLRAYAAQYTVMENANDLCRLAIRTCGGQAMLKSFALERLYRDSRCGALMLPWTAELCLDRLGRETLYEPGETDD